MSVSAGAASAAATRKATRRRAASRDVTKVSAAPQLMEACLAGNLSRVRELVERGANVSEARDVPPLAFFTGAIGAAMKAQQQQRAREGELGSAGKGGEKTHMLDTTSATAAAAGMGGNASKDARAFCTDALSPLSVMLLSGLNTPGARDVIAFLLQQGAGVNDLISFAEPSMDGEEGEADAEDRSQARGRRTSNGSRKASAEERRGGKGSGRAGSRHASLFPGTEAVAAGGAAANGTDSRHPSTEAELRGGDTAVPTISGSLLHYAVSAGDHAQLLRLLLLAHPLPSQDDTTTSTSRGQRTESWEADLGTVPMLPQSLLAAVEQETVVGALCRMHLSPSGTGGTDLDKKTAAAATMNDAVSPAAGTQKGGKGKAAPVLSPTVNTGGESASPTSGTAARPQLPQTPIDMAQVLSPESAAAVLSAFTHRQAHVLSYDGIEAAMEEGMEDDVHGRPPRRLPALMSLYPQPTEGQTTQERSPKSWWSLRKLWHIASSTSPPQQQQKFATTTAEGVPVEEQAITPVAEAQPRRCPFALDLSMEDTTGRTAAAIALARRDGLSLHLLRFFGATMPFEGLVNSSQTRLARACTAGNADRVQELLRLGDSLTQISSDGRYTLVHYAVAQPAVLRLLVERGLSLESENLYGESALHSLLRHGGARNSEKYEQSLRTMVAGAWSVVEGGANSNSATAALSNAVVFTQLSAAAQRNYILCPASQLPSLALAGHGGVPGTAGASGAGGRNAASARGTSVQPRGGSVVNNQLSKGGPTAAAAGKAAESAAGTDAAEAGCAMAAAPFFGGREYGTWWSFLPPIMTTAEALEGLLKAGAIAQGYAPDEDLDLAYVRFAEALAADGGAGEFSLGGENDDMDSEEEMERARENGYDDGELSGTRNTLCPSGYGGASGRRQRRPQPFPGRLPVRVTPLQQAILDYQPEVIRLLVMEYRVDPMQRDSQGATALHYAALCTHAPSVLELLLSPQVMAMHVKPGAPTTTAAGGNTSSNTNNATGNSGEAPVSVAAATKSKLDLNAVDMAGRTVLFYAALVGNDAAVRLLLRFGSMAHVGRADRRGCTPLYIASRHRHPSVVEMLLKHSNDLLSTAMGSGGGIGGGLVSDRLGGSGRLFNLRSSGSRRASPRSSSLRGGSRTRNGGGGGYTNAATEALFANGGVALVNVEAEDGTTGMTALEMLAKQSLSPSAPADPAQVRIATALLAEGQATVLRPSGLRSGGTLLHRVVSDGQVELTELLLSFFADPNDVDARTETPLFIALRVPSMLRTLDGTSSLRVALARTLLRYGASLFVQSGGCLDTPLHLALRTLSSSADDAEELLQLLFYTEVDTRLFAARGAPFTDRRDRGRRGSRRPHSTRRGEAKGRRAEGRVWSRVGPSGAISSENVDLESDVAPQRRTTQRQQRSGSNSIVTYLADADAGGASWRHPKSGSSADDSGRVRRAWSQRSAEEEEDRDSGEAPLGQSATSPEGSVRSRTHQLNSYDAELEDDEAKDLIITDEQDETAIMRDGGEVNSEMHVREAETEDPLDRARRVRLQWQSPEHLIAPAECWPLTNSTGQSLLHVLCLSASPTVQKLSATQRLLEDLQLFTQLSDPALAAKASVDAAAAVDDEQDYNGNGHGGGRRAQDSAWQVMVRLWWLPDADGRTPLHAATQSGFVAAASVILAQCPGSVVAVDLHGRTPLHTCVLMPTHNPDSAETDALIDDEAAAAVNMQKMLTLLRSTLTRMLTSYRAIPLQGLPLRRTAQDVLPTRPAAAAASVQHTSKGVRVDAADDAAAAQVRKRAIAILVQSSTITEQLQRWQQARLWGRPALNAKAPPVREASSEAEVTSWRSYLQLPDGQGRTALLLAAEVGSRVAARALIQQAQ